jgi:hypothetical protein
MARKSAMARRIEIEEARRNETAARLAGMTEAAIATELMGLVEESATLSREWGRDGASDAWCSLQAIRINDGIEACRAALRTRRIAA